MENGNYQKELTPEQILRVIFSYAAKIANEKSLDQLLILMADMGRDLIVADRCTMWLIDKNQNQLWTKVAHGVDEIRIPLHSGLVGYAISKNESLIIDDAYLDSRFNREVDKKTGYCTKAVMVIPFQNNNGEIMGAYQAVNKMTVDAVFTQQDMEHLTLAASYAAKSLEAAILHREIEETQKEIIFTIAEIGESRSKETGLHVKRVAEYSYLLALKYGLSEQEAEVLRVVSPMHDIGKVAIPDAVLEKSGKLTEEEFEVIKSHTNIGHQLLNKSPRKLLQAAAIVAHQHHEKWNGKGYPRGIAGKDIHIFARITAIADVFDALASERVYKRAWELDRILALFREESGQHFDPELMDIFMDNLDEFLLIRDAHVEHF
ncbi:MAG TPA: HD domain-containing phosphohydrolase [Bacillota bacterium]|nr:HD domain-containing phosphohydrolase [Bacillota bacterium]